MIEGGCYDKVEFPLYEKSIKNTRYDGISLRTVSTNRKTAAKRVGRGFREYDSISDDTSSVQGK